MPRLQGKPALNWQFLPTSYLPGLSPASAIPRPKTRGFRTSRQPMESLSLIAKRSTLTGELNRGGLGGQRALQVPVPAAGQCPSEGAGEHNVTGQNLCAFPTVSE